MRAISARVRVGAAVLVAASVLAGAAPALAAGNGKGGSPTPSGSCAVNPDPVAVGADYTLSGSGLGADQLVNVLIADAGGTTSWNLQADGSGTASVTWHSYFTGTSTVAFQETAHHGSTVVAECAFSVI